MASILSGKTTQQLRQKTSFLDPQNCKKICLTIHHMGHNSVQGFQVMKGLVMMIKVFF